MKFLEFFFRGIKKLLVIHESWTVNLDSVLREKLYTYIFFTFQNRFQLYTFLFLLVLSF